MKLGQSAVFVCEANGNPRPSIGWKREDDRPLSGAKAGNNFTDFFEIPIFSVKRAWRMKNLFRYLLTSILLFMIFNLLNLLFL